MCVLRRDIAWKDFWPFCSDYIVFTQSLIENPLESRILKFQKLLTLNDFDSTQLINCAHLGVWLMIKFLKWYKIKTKVENAIFSEEHLWFNFFTCSGGPCPGFAGAQQIIIGIQQKVIIYTTARSFLITILCRAFSDVILSDKSYTCTLVPPKLYKVFWANVMGKISASLVFNWLRMIFCPFEKLPPIVGINWTRNMKHAFQYFKDNWN